jgi:hypothetical protein
MEAQRVVKAGICLFVVLAVGAHGQTYSGPYATMATVNIKVRDVDVSLRLEEKVAFMFIAAIDTLEQDCRTHMKRLCTIKEMVEGVKAPDDWPMRVLAYDPTTDDTQYTYSLTIEGIRWKLAVAPKRERLAGFYVERGTRYFNAKGAASATDPKVTEAEINGESFAVRRK